MKINPRVIALGGENASMGFTQSIMSTKSKIGDDGGITLNSLLTKNGKMRGS